MNGLKVTGDTHMTNSPPLTIRSGNHWVGVVLLAGFTAFGVVVVGLGTSALLPEEGDSPWLLGLLVALWSGVLGLVGATIHTALHAVRFGRSTLRLDAPLHAGGWISGVVEAPAALGQAVIQVSVDCIMNYYRNSWQRDLLWQDLKLVDGTRLSREGNRILIPVAAQLPADARPTDHDRKRRRSLDWTVQVQASLPGMDYETVLAVTVQPPDTARTSVATAPSRSIPELPLESLAQRLAAQFQAVGGDVAVPLPTPIVRMALTGLFAIVAIALAVPGLLPDLGVEGEVLAKAAMVAGGLSAFMFLLLMLANRAIEVGSVAVRIRRGVFGLGFHSRIPVSEITAVETVSPRPDTNPQIYGVVFRTRSGALHRAAGRRDAVHAKALAQALSYLLPSHSTR